LTSPLVVDLPLELARPVSIGDEVIVIASVWVSEDEAPPRAGQFIWLGMNAPEREELRIILGTGERELHVAPLEHDHPVSDLLTRPTQYAQDEPDYYTLNAR
jgi:hypothetical protein